MFGPFATTSRLTPIHQVSPLYCRTPPAQRCPWWQRVTEGTAVAPWNGPNYLGDQLRWAFLVACRCLSVCFISFLVPYTCFVHSWLNKLIDWLIVRLCEMLLRWPLPSTTSAVKLDRNLKPKLAIMRECTSVTVTDRQTGTDIVA